MNESKKRLIAESKTTRGQIDGILKILEAEIKITNISF